MFFSFLIFTPPYPKDKNPTLFYPMFWVRQAAVENRPIRMGENSFLERFKTVLAHGVNLTIIFPG
jgi:hypothetical protein